jgi:hypothetical protein
MSQRQLRLVFSRSMPVSSKPCKMSLASRSTRSQQRGSQFLRKMRELERLSPNHARVLEGIAEGVIAQMLGAQLE